MDKGAIKKYAVWARRELISRVSQKAQQYGVSENEIADADADTVNGHLLSANEKKQRLALINRIKQIGYQQTMEEAAYTWFNRFSALRFMEVNGYLPTHVRVFTDEENAFKPQILSEAIHLDLEGLNLDKVYELKEADKTEELYKYLLITQCNALSAILPVMFTRIEDYTELLFPENLLREGSVIEQMISLIPEDDWKDAVQIIGWFYQYYNAEPKDKVFADLKKNIKISKENIPAATQLFTPDWIVRYMVENSLGRLWVEGHPNNELKSNWKYYLEEAEQEPEVQAQLDEIRKEYAALKPEDIKAIDPCMGSGHILVYMFDVLVQIYEAYGYNAREAAGLILQNNLYGLDIDDRAAQLAYFAVMMKARQYDRRIFSRGIQPHVHAIVESNGISRDVIDYFENGRSDLKKALETIITELHDAKEYGSILNVTSVDFAALNARLEEIRDDISLFGAAAQNELLPIINVAKAMSQKYHTVVTNPPYMGAPGMSVKLSDYVKKNYPDSKSDLFAVFIEKCGQMTVKNGYHAMITQHAWMFLSSFVKLREKLLTYDMVNMAHLGARAFEEIGGEVVQTTSFTERKSNIIDYKGRYCRLLEPTTQQGKEDMFLAGKNRYTAKQENFSKIPGSPVAYWISERLLRLFSMPRIEDYAEVATGISTGKNDLYVRNWYEVSFNRISIYETDIESINFYVIPWIPYNKGGEARKWYGNNDCIVLWRDSNKFHRPRPIFKHLYLREGLTWSFVTTGMFSSRYYPQGFLWDVAGSPCVAKSKSLLMYTLAFLSTKIASTILQITNPTMNCQVIDIQRLPLVYKQDEEKSVNCISEASVSLSKTDWDSFETSWDFKRHPLVFSVKNRNQVLDSLRIAFEQADCSIYIKSPSLETAKEFINDCFAGRCKGCIVNIDFISDKSIFAKSEHMVSCYAIGKYLYRNIGVIFESFDEKYFTELGDTTINFEYLWFLCCLSHDLLSKYEKECQNDTYADLDDFIARCDICHTIYSPNLPDDIVFEMPFYHTYSENTVKEYFADRLNDSENKGVDHGIAEGYLLFDLLVKNYLSASSKKGNKRDFATYERNGHTLLWRKEQLWAFALVADAVISHNIWHKAPNMQTRLIPETAIGNEEERKLSVTGNPLAFLFGIVDSLEPLKYFYTKNSSEVFDSMKIGIENDTIVFCSAYPLDAWYRDKIAGLSDWISSVETTFTNGEVKISFSNNSLESKYAQWEKECNTRFNQLKANEEELNRIFIDIYGLQDELTPEVDEKDVTVRKADLGRDIRSLISYAVGCMFGRYSLDCEGLVYAGGEWDASKYTTFPADKDNIIPICDDDYFDDDITGRFIKWVETVYGATSLESNLKFIADALGGKGTPRDVIRSYFLNDFYADHLKIYQKRPIYWLFDSGKKNGFKALIYMHRYQPDTIARMRTDYVHEQQARYRTIIEDLDKQMKNATQTVSVKLKRQLQNYQAQAAELHTYEEKIHHLADQMISIDLDDGVKVNYAKFESVLAKIK